MMKLQSKILAALFLPLLLGGSLAGASEDQRTRAQSQTAQASGALSEHESANRARVLQANAPPVICFERVDDTGRPLNLAFLPSGGGRAIVADQRGNLSLVRVPPVGSKQPMQWLGTFLDLTGRVFSRGEQGLLGLALHPQFARNGRFFVSYICDSVAHPDCKGPCPCTAATGCVPGAAPVADCRYNTVVAEYWAGRQPATSTRASTAEKRRLLTFARPFSNHNGGDLFFGRDKYLYYTSGDGGSAGDPWNFAQKGSTLFGKILRLDVDKVPRGKTYGIPPSNPFAKVTGVRPEIFALGLRNPWRVTVDRASGNIWAADVGQDKVEEIDLIRAGGNYGWHNLEGTVPYMNTSATPGGFTPVSQMLGKLSGPVLEYTHKEVGPGPKSVTGGYVYRAAKRNKCLQGKYIYNDLYGPMWVGTINTAPRTTVRVEYRCSSDTPIACPVKGAGSDLGGVMWSWAEDVLGDVYVMSNAGVYRITDLTKCGSPC
eukprot:jgi/Mesen1/2325/ME000155S01416